MTPPAYPQSARWESDDDRPCQAAWVDPIRAEQARHQVSRIASRLRILDLAAAIHNVAATYRVGLELMVGTRREARIVKARHQLWHAMRALGMSYPRIAAIVERDHKSVMYGVKRADAELLVRGEAA